MKQITREWLRAAEDDLAAAELLLTDEHLTNVVSFHAQQAVEKSFKALIEECDLGSIKIHSLERLYGKIKHLTVVKDLETLRRLNTLYIESRYPGELGLLPEGKPTKNDAFAFLTFAHGIYSQVFLFLQQPNNEQQINLI